MAFNTKVRVMAVFYTGAYMLVAWLPFALGWNWFLGMAWGILLTAYVLFAWFVFPEKVIETLSLHAGAIKMPDFIRRNSVYQSLRLRFPWLQKLVA